MTTFYGGPFVIPKQNVEKALTAWNEWKTNSSSYFITVHPSVYDTVKIHILQTSIVVDIRHTINTRPFVAISNLDGNAPTQTAMMGCIYQNKVRQCPREDGYGWGSVFGVGNAGCRAFTPQDDAGLEFNIHYSTYDCAEQIKNLTSSTCLTTFSEPHWTWNVSTGPSYIAAMKSFVYSGANFFAQCASVQSYEDSANVAGRGTFLTDFGINAVNPDDGINTESESLNTLTNFPDLPACQYLNPISSAITGAVPDFYNVFGNEVIRDYQSTTNNNPPPYTTHSAANKLSY